MKFRKKPVVVEATQWMGSGSEPSNVTPIWEYRDVWLDSLKPCTHCGSPMHEHGWIDTLESGHIVCPGDWIITGVKGEHYPCKPDVFEATYEPVTE